MTKHKKSGQPLFQAGISEDGLAQALDKKRSRRINSLKSRGPLKVKSAK
jgi:hypothetical protein